MKLLEIYPSFNTKLIKIEPIELELSYFNIEISTKYTFIEFIDSTGF